MSELHGLQTRITDFERAGARVIAVSPDSVEENKGVRDRFDLAFPILSDPELELTKALGLVHEGAFQGRDVPRPATFIVRDGVIVWRDLTDNWRVRIQAGELLDALHRVLAEPPTGSS
jgi:peroxiredoxin Q/BCP